MLCMMKISPDIQALLDAKDKQIAELEARVKELIEKMGKDSRNSGKPPSSDGFKKKTKSLRVASGLKPGGQPGHKGTTLKRVKNPEYVKRIRCLLPAINAERLRMRLKRRLHNHGK